MGRIKLGAFIEVQKAVLKCTPARSEAVEYMRFLALKRSFQSTFRERLGHIWDVHAAWACGKRFK